MITKLFLNILFPQENGKNIVESSTSNNDTRDKKKVSQLTEFIDNTEPNEMEMLSRITEENEEDSKTAGTPTSVLSSPFALLSPESNIKRHGESMLSDSSDPDASVALSKNDTQDSPLPGFLNTTLDSNFSGLTVSVFFFSFF